MNTAYLKTFYKKYIEKAIVPTIVITLVFFMNMKFFGMDNTMIGPFITLSFLRFRNVPNHYECMLKTYLIYVAMTILASIAVLSLPLCIIVNAVALVWLAYVLIDEYNPTNYFPAAMALIFFQMAPAWGKDLGIRLIALTASFAIVFVVIVILSIRQKKDPIREHVKHGLSICASMIMLCENNTGDSEFENLRVGYHKELCQVNSLISQEIYTYNRSSIRLADKINWYCQFVALFQVINSLCYFPDDCDGIQKARQLLDKYANKFENIKPGKDYKRLNFRENKPDIRMLRVRFALRLLIVVTPCMVFAYATGWKNVYWLVISVFFMSVPMTENTRTRVRQRFIGTICGIVVCFVLFTIFTGLPERIIIMTIANFLIYGAPNYAFMVTYITCSALAITSMDGVVTTVLLQRLIYTCIGAVIVLITNKYVFPIYTGKEMEFLKESLAKQRKKMAELSVSDLDDEERKHQKDQVLIKSYMLMKRLENYHAMLPEDLQDPDFSTYQRAHAMSLSSFLDM